MQVPIVAGIYRDNGQLQPAYPVNQIPTPKQSGISAGYLRPAHGLVAYGQGQGHDRGAITWRETLYRVSGNQLIKIDSNNAVTLCGFIAGSTPVTLDYGFDRLLIIGGGIVYYYDGSALTSLTVSGLGYIIDGCWVDGYYLLTDGTSLIVTELNNPYVINPLKYGSSEADPDVVVSVKRIRTEVYVANRNTVEVFDNVGGQLFPFQRIDGAMVNKGAVGTKAVCVFNDTIVFVGGSRNESIGVYIAQNASAWKISTPSIDAKLGALSLAELSGLHIEARLDQSHQWIYIHLPDQTLVYDAAASQIMEQPIWHILTSTLSGFSRYQAENYAWCYGKWHVGNPIGTQIGILSEVIGSHWGNPVRWELSTSILYNQTNGAIFQRLELVALVGNVALGENPKISTSYSEDGVTWSQPRAVSVGTIGQRSARLLWLQQGFMKMWRIQRFQGDSSAHITAVALEATLEALAW